MGRLPAPINRPARESPRCNGHSARTGEPCKNWPIHGGNVCVTHGGRAPHVKKAAAERIAEMVDPALAALRRLVDEADSDSVRLSAVKEILDRHLGRAKQAVDVTSGGVPLVRVVAADDLELLVPE